MVPSEQKKSEQIHAVTALAQKAVPVEHQGVFQSFAHEFFFNLTSFDLEEKDPEIWAPAVIQLWQLFQKRAPGELKVRAYNQETNEEGCMVRRGVLDILNDDMPFLASSVLEAIKSLNFRSTLCIHPVVRVLRDEDGHLASHCSPRNKDCHGHPESLIRCELAQDLTPEQIFSLEEEITRTLTDVRSACADWEPMRHKMREAASGLEHCPEESTPQHTHETQAFLHWLDEHHFTFLGHCQYDFSAENARNPKHSGLGILRDTSRDTILSLLNAPDEGSFLKDPSTPLMITKASQRSSVHRRQFMDSIGIKKYGPDGQVVGLYQFLGLFTSRAHRASAREIPLLSSKIQNILDQSGLAPHWHDGKAIVDILETLPRDELLQTPIEALLTLSLSVLRLQHRKTLRSFVRIDPFSRYASCLIYLPRDNYSAALRKKMGGILEASLGGTLSLWGTHLSNLSYARIHYIISFTGKAATPELNLADLENQLAQATLTWEDSLYRALKEEHGLQVSRSLFEKFQGAFSSGYQEQFSAVDAVEDIQHIEKAIQENKVCVSLKILTDDPVQRFLVKVYNPRGLMPLSDISPILARMGLRIVTENPFLFQKNFSNQPDGSLFGMHVLNVLPQKGAPDISRSALTQRFAPAFDKIWSQDLENDTLNQLILTAHLHWRECALLRTYTRYFKQLQVPFNPSYVADILNQYPSVVRQLLDLFHALFDPDISDETRQNAENTLNHSIQEHLRQVDQVDAEHILRRFWNLIQSTLRTNFYQQDQAGQPRPGLALKISTPQITDLPLPQPTFEIFVCAPQVEGIHLRGGPIARGGIRWSDRQEDYRTEIRDLWKTQMVKNTVVVPVGAKGGFILKGDIETDAQTRSQRGLDGYQLFIQSLLDVTDNWNKGQIVPPTRVIRRDGDDPYLVVAADKGTSTFSDYANALSHQENFWISDAFASGGSVGYDHKKMGITARGAWKSVVHHFQSIGIDVATDPIQVIGVGDMAGDVFGNGMLLSSALKLVAAFNHQHIFIDPDPNPQKSYQERQRLFQLPCSTWNDYNPTALSPGGAIFERSARSLSLSPQIQALLQIESELISPDELIKTLLKAPVDLLWFGGIGTFIKGSAESHSDVMDHANERVRVNGCEVQSRVIAEGANLGSTQRGRIEYAATGGRINTDALDNSGGVDCSDHEVNIKILLQDCLNAGALTMEERNHLLEEMTPEVAGLVLQNNQEQNAAVSSAQIQSITHLESYATLMRDLEDTGLLDRRIDCLPDDTELAARKVQGRGLTRPELCVLLSYAKMRLFHELSLAPNLLDPPFVNLLHTYFPSLCVQKFPDALARHPLRREIVASVLTNKLINATGPHFVYEVSQITGASCVQVSQAWLWAEECLAGPIGREHLIGEHRKTCLRHLIVWFSQKNNFEGMDPSHLAQYQNGFDAILASVPADTPSHDLLAQNGGDIIQSSQKTGRSITEIIHTYSIIAERLNLSWIQSTLTTFTIENPWHMEASHALYQDFRQAQKSLAHAILDETPSQMPPCIKNWTQKNADSLHLYDKQIRQAQNYGTPDWAAILLLSRTLRLLSQEMDT